MSKKALSGSEVHAHSKNRHEQKHLQGKLEQLSHSEFMIRDQNRQETQKWRQFLRDNMKSSGWSPMAMHPDTDEFDDDSDFFRQFGDDFLSPTSPRRRFDQQYAQKFQKPWAYTFNSESHNKVYKELALAGENSKKLLMTPRPVTSPSTSVSSQEHPRLAQHVTTVKGLERARSAWSRCTDRMLPARETLLPARPKTSLGEHHYVEYSDLSRDTPDSPSGSHSYQLERQVSKMSLVTRAKSPWTMRNQTPTTENELEERPATVEGPKRETIPKLARSVTILSGLHKTKEIWICSVCGGDTRGVKDKDQFAQTALVYKGLQRAKSVLERLKSQTYNRVPEEEEKDSEETEPTSKSRRCSCRCKTSTSSESSQSTPRRNNNKRQSPGKDDSKKSHKTNSSHSGVSRTKSNDTPRNTPRQPVRSKSQFMNSQSASGMGKTVKENSTPRKKNTLSETISSLRQADGDNKEISGANKTVSETPRRKKISQTLFNSKTETVNNSDSRKESEFNESVQPELFDLDDNVFNTTEDVTRTGDVLIPETHRSGNNLWTKVTKNGVAQSKSDRAEENRSLSGASVTEENRVSQAVEINSGRGDNSEQLKGSRLLEKLIDNQNDRVPGEGDSKVHTRIDSAPGTTEMARKHEDVLVSEEQIGQQDVQAGSFIEEKKLDSVCEQDTVRSDVRTAKNRRQESVMSNVSDVLSRKLKEKKVPAADRDDIATLRQRGRQAGNSSRRSTAYSTSELVVFFKRVKNRVGRKNQGNVFHKIGRVMLEKQKVLRAEKAAAAAAATHDNGSSNSAPTTPTSPNAPIHDSRSGTNLMNGRVSDHKAYSRKRSTGDDKNETHQVISNKSNKSGNTNLHDNAENSEANGMNTPNELGECRDDRQNKKMSQSDYSKNVSRINDSSSSNNNNINNHDISNNNNRNSSRTTSEEENIRNNNANDTHDGTTGDNITAPGANNNNNNNETDSLSANSNSVINSTTGKSNMSNGVLDYGNTELKGLGTKRYVEHKGVRIRNYVSPHLRYKTAAARDRERRDVSVRWHASEGAMVTTYQCQEPTKMVDVVFPKNARQKALAKMVEENHTQPISNAAKLADAELRRRIDQFLTSVKPFCQSERK